MLIIYIKMFRAPEVLKEELDQQVQEDHKGQQAHGEPWVYQDHQELM